MKKSYIITIAAVLAVVLVGVCVFMGGDIKTRFGNEGTTAAEEISHISDDSYKALVASSIQTKTPILHTTIDGIFYTMDTEKNVQFYKYSASGFEAIDETGVYEITVTVGYQDLTADVHYYTDEETEATTGYGLFLSGDDSSVLIYDYAFFCLTDLPTDFASSGKMLVMVDTDKEDFCSDNKVYEEPYYGNPDGGSMSRFLYSDNRTIDDRGAPRADYCMMTPAVVADCDGEILFFSSRHYNLFENEHKMDIFQSGGWGNNEDNNRYIQDIVGFYAENTEDGVRYFQRTDNGFTLMVGEDEIKEFEGDFYEDYILCGEYILGKTSLEIYSIEDDASYIITAPDGAYFEADLFAINDGKFVMRGVADLASAAILVGSLDGNTSIYYNEKFAYIVSPIVTADGKAVLDIAQDDSGSSYNVEILNIN